nr:tRNA lysidine(34) synthetase TilS [Pseudomonas sp.]
GMGAMAASMQRDGLTYLRPWLEFERARIAEQALALAAELGLTLVDDPSNLDTQYARGALRTQVFPAIAGHWPGYRQTLSRFARLSGQAAEVLAEVAQADLRSMRRSHPAYGDTLDLLVWRKLSPARRSLALRAWLEHQGVAMPPEARLSQMCRQLQQAAPDRQVLLQHSGIQVRSYRNLVMIDRNAGAGKAARAPEPMAQAAPACVVHWQGQPSVPLPELGGTLHFDSAAHGLDGQWLQAQPLRVTLRRGRERLRPGVQGPSRSLKNLYQEAGIPAWERTRLPLVWRGATLLFAAGLGLDGRAPRAPDGVMLRWESDSPGATVSGPHDKPPPNAG